MRSQINHIIRTGALFLVVLDDDDDDDDDELRLVNVSIKSRTFCVPFPLLDIPCNADQIA